MQNNRGSERANNIPGSADARLIFCVSREVKDRYRESFGISEVKLAVAQCSPID